MKNNNDNGNFINFKQNIPNKNNSSILNSFKTIPIVNLFYKHRKFIFLILTILSMISIIRVPYVGVFFDNFVFGLFFGYFRYVFYAFVFLYFLYLLFGFEDHIKIKNLNIICFIVLIILSSWTYVIYMYIHNNGNHNLNFHNLWKKFGDLYKQGWNNRTAAISQNYSDIPGGILGVFIYSIFFMFKNYYFINIIYWLVTVLMFFLLIGYFIFHDFLFLIRIFTAIKLIFLEFLGLLHQKLFLKSQFLFSNWVVKNNKAYKINNQITKEDNFLNFLKNTSSSPRTQHLYATNKFDKLLTTSIKKTYDENDYIKSSFQNRTKEILNTTIFKNIHEEQALADQKLYENDFLHSKMAKDNILYGTQNYYKKSPFGGIKKVYRNEKKSKNNDDNFVTLSQKTLISKLTFFKYNLQRINNNYKIFDLSKLKFAIKKENIKQIKKYALTKEGEIMDVFTENNIQMTIIKINVSNKSIQYELKIPNNVAISKVKKLLDNLKLALAQEKLFLTIPIPGKNTIGIDIPNPYFSILTFKDVFMPIQQQNEFNNLKGKLFIGQKANGENIIEKFSEMPHLLIAGASGSGKSVGMKNIILSLAITHKPNELNMILIDPKKVEFNSFYNLPHLLTPIIYDFNSCELVLSHLLREMLQRYKILKKFRVTNIDEYNLKQKNEENKLPKIIVLMDEFAEFILQNKKKIEEKIVRISQLARAAGIHLIIATQRPVSQVITGLIKMNFSCRMAFACASSIDSRIILDTNGAEDLLGNGDMMYISTKNSHPQRLQVPFINQENVDKICNFLRSSQEPVYVPFLSNEDEEGINEDEDDDFEVNNDEINENSNFNKNINFKKMSLKDKIYYLINNENRFTEDMKIKMKKIINFILTQKRIAKTHLIQLFNLSQYEILLVIKWLTAKNIIVRSKYNNFYDVIVENNDTVEILIKKFANRIKNDG